MILGKLNLDREAFLAQHWQRKPLLIRNAFGVSHPADRDELAGLAMEDEVESRIIEQRDGRWQLQHGPFQEAISSANIPGHCWCRQWTTTSPTLHSCDSWSILYRSGEWMM